MRWDDEMRWDEMIDEMWCDVMWYRWWHDDDDDDDEMIDDICVE